MIIITGMHRSGTSCITGMLYHAGADIGYHPKPRGSFDNSKGHFEHKLANKINDLILVGSSGSWSKPPEEEKIFTSPHLLLYRRAIQSFQKQFFGQIVKDPRFCLTLPLWAGICNIEALIWCRRDPISVAKSLNRRDQYSIERGLELHRIYEDQFSKYLPSFHSITLHFEDVAKDPNIVFEKVANLLPITDPDRGRNFYEEKLRHF